MRFIEWVVFISLGLIWGSSFLWIKIAVQEVSPLLLVSLRLLFAIFTLLGVALATKPPWPKDLKTWEHLTILGIFNNGLPYLLITWGELYIESAVAAILNCSVPLFTMIGAHFFTKDERISGIRILSLLAGFSGVFILVSRDLSSGYQSTLIGQAAVLLAAVSYAFSSIYARNTTSEVSPIVRALIPLFGADIILWSLTLAIESPISLPTLPITWVAIIWLGIIGVGIAYILYFYLIHTIGATRTTLVTYIFPLVGVLLGVIFLGERFDLNLLLGSLMIISSIAIINHQK